jgi:hypothetical protein
LIPPFLPGSESKHLGGVKKPAYRTKVREKGKWVRVGTGLPRNRAIRVGADYVDNTTARSFTIEKTGSKTTKGDDAFFFRANKFRKKKPRSKIKREPTCIEKSTYAIDTPGELRGITAKGLKASRAAAKRRAAGDFFFGNKKKRNKRGGLLF